VIALLRLLCDLVLAFVAPRAALVAENLILRQQLIVIRRQIKRPRLRRFDRWLIGALAGRFQLLMDIVLLVKPETVIGWHRAAWRLLWRWRSPNHLLCALREVAPRYSSSSTWRAAPLEPRRAHPRPPRIRPGIDRRARRERTADPRA
jgi:hypothetical protein